MKLLHTSDKTIRDDTPSHYLYSLYGIYILLNEGVEREIIQEDY